jgi:hypothetical protein
MKKFWIKSVPYRLITDICLFSMRYWITYYNYHLHESSVQKTPQKTNLCICVCMYTYVYRIDKLKTNENEQELYFLRKKIVQSS